MNRIIRKIKLMLRNSQYCQNCSNPNHRRKLTIEEWMCYVGAYIGTVIGLAVFEEVELLTEESKGD